jgi:hypothetical protein
MINVVKVDQLIEKSNCLYCLIRKKMQTIALMDIPEIDALT